MSNCIDCQDCLRVQDIPECTEIINICTDLELEDTTYAYIQNLATGHINRYQTSVDSGLLQIEVEQVLMPEVSYALWVNNTPETPMKQELITVDTFETNCIRFDVFRYYNMYYDGITSFEASFQVKNRE